MRALVVRHAERRGTTPAEFRTVIGEQRAKWAALARAHGIKPRGQ
jgi:hypothetical protein